MSSNYISRHHISEDKSSNYISRHHISEDSIQSIFQGIISEDGLQTIFQGITFRKTVFKLYYITSDGSLQTILQGVSRQSSNCITKRYISEQSSHYITKNHNSEDNLQAVWRSIYTLLHTTAEDIHNFNRIPMLYDSVILLVKWLCSSLSADKQETYTYRGRQRSVWTHIEYPWQRTCRSLAVSRCAIQLSQLWLLYHHECTACLRASVCWETAQPSGTKRDVC
jgi:hypothetical protein